MINNKMISGPISGGAFANRLGADIMVGAKTGDVPSVRGRIAGR
jgi:hypothetical protein